MKSCARHRQGPSPFRPPFRGLRAAFRLAAGVSHDAAAVAGERAGKAGPRLAGRASTAIFNRFGLSI
jgi:hypothetical protein